MKMKKDKGAIEYSMSIILLMISVLLILFCFRIRSARVEKAVSSVEGVTSCSVNLLTNSMSVEGTASENEIVSAVAKAESACEMIMECLREMELEEQKVLNEHTEEER